MNNKKSGGVIFVALWCFCSELFAIFAHAKSCLWQNAHRDVIHAKMYPPTWCHLYFTHIYYFISFNRFYHFSMTKMSLSLFLPPFHGDESHGGSHRTLCRVSAPPMSPNLWDAPKDARYRCPHIAPVQLPCPRTAVARRGSSSHVPPEWGDCRRGGAVPPASWGAD
jgi:hypothetical protein